MSPYCLIQEHVWPDEWLILLSCVLLNCTKRSQVERVVRLEDVSTAHAVIDIGDEKLKDLIRPLGFVNRRSAMMKSLAADYVVWDHRDPRVLRGVGHYANRAWEIFVKDRLGDDEPHDGALKLYWKWRMRLEAQKESQGRQR